MKQAAKLELTTYHDTDHAVLPDYCQKLNVYQICEDDIPVVYVFVEPMKEAA